jgi:hypothetical protein
LLCTRRAIRYGFTNIKEPFELVEVLSNQMGEFFPVKAATTIGYQCS